VFPARAPEGHNATDCGLNDVEMSLGVECGDGRSGSEQAGYQLALLVCTLTIAIIGGVVTGTSNLSQEYFHLLCHISGFCLNSPESFLFVHYKN